MPNKFTHVELVDRANGETVQVRTLEDAARRFAQMANCQYAECRAAFLSGQNLTTCAFLYRPISKD